MAQIQKYQAQTALVPDAGGVPSVNLQDYGGRALQGLGGAIESAAQMFQQREEQKEDFKAQDGLRRMQLETGRELQERALNMEEDGAGFHDSFLTDVYTPKRNDFLNSLPPRLRERYETMLGDGGSATEEWSIKAATAERDQLFGWYDRTLGDSREQLAAAVAMDPDAYDTLYEQGMAEIEASGLPPSKKEEHRRAWEQMAQVAHLNRMLETNPEAVLRDLGADPRQLSPNTQYGMLREALIHVESSGDGTAISPKGAIGLMQVMPGTARDISKELGDGLIDAGMSDERITEILSNESINQRYGDHYLKKQIRDFGQKGGLEAALIAYNGGPVRAQKWIDSGFDDSVLPLETRNYYKKVMSRLPTTPGSGLDRPAGDPNNVQFEFKRSPLLGDRTPGEESISRDLSNRVRTAFAGIGIDKIKINSGFRSPEHNKEVGGASGSRHQHGDAMDIDVSGYSHQQRVEIIRALSASGLTGLGIGANIIHADLGGRRAWGYANSAGGGEVPKWAKAAIDEHLASKSSMPRRGPDVAGRYSTLPYTQRQQFINNADTALGQRMKSQATASTAEKGALRREIRNELAAIQNTGTSTSSFDETMVSTVLGEADYNKFIADRDRAMRTYNALDGVEQMGQEEMEEQLRFYAPVEGSDTFADDLQVERALQRKIDETIRMRSSKPVEAALKYPEVAEAWATIRDADEPDAASVQEFIRLNLERQAEFNLKPGSQQPVPREWSLQIGRSMASIPTRAGGASAQEVNMAIVLQFEALREVFGEYTDEVVTQALADYNGLGQGTAEQLTSIVEGMASGRDVIGNMRQRLEQAQDRDQVEQLAEPGWWDKTKNFLFGTDNEQAAAAMPDPVDESAVEGDPLLDEKVTRVLNMMSSYGEVDPEDEAYLVERFGEPAVRIAMQRRNGQ